MHEEISLLNILQNVNNLITFFSHSAFPGMTDRVAIQIQNPIFKAYFDLSKYRLLDTV